MLNGLFHGLSWIGLAISNHSKVMYHVVLAERKLTSYVYAVGKQPASNL
ncbi:hypothetical protein TIFTF001_050583 [Ficus carica]|uniref:Uncharacterized protein n=1 Tax=Ficus carica TaxID=3494 RepID=A0AA88CP63_FICCA|nr:hypothetical protein TIFTF001_050583 [Ficus carica]